MRGSYIRQRQLGLLKGEGDDSDFRTLLYLVSRFFDTYDGVGGKPALSLSSLANDALPFIGQLTAGATSRLAGTIGFHLYGSDQV